MPFKDTILRNRETNITQSFLVLLVELVLASIVRGTVYIDCIELVIMCLICKNVNMTLLTCGVICLVKTIDTLCGWEWLVVIPFQKHTFIIVKCCIEDIILIKDEK